MRFYQRTKFRSLNFLALIKHLKWKFGGKFRLIAVTELFQKNIPQRKKRLNVHEEGESHVKNIPICGKQVHPCNGVFS